MPALKEKKQALLGQNITGGFYFGVSTIEPLILSQIEGIFDPGSIQQQVNSCNMKHRKGFRDLPQAV